MHEEVGWIPLPDGRRLHSRIWRPDAGEPVGAVLGYDPYPNQWLTRAADAPHGRELTDAGLAYVRVAIAGSGDSDGLLRDEYLASELQDGVDVIAWLAEQPWCNGKVGMRGLSWGGFNSLQIAALRPAALAAVVSACSTDDRYVDDVHYMGGCVLGYDMQLWATWAHLFFVAPPDPAIVGDEWRARWLERLDGVEPIIATWLAHQTRDEYWLHGSVGVDPHAITAPVLMVGGWEDGYRDAILRFLEARPARTWAVIGPWGHGWPHRVLPGPHVDWVAREVRWWRHWLSGDENGVEGDGQVEVFVQDARLPTERLLRRSGRWVRFDASEMEASRVELAGPHSSDLLPERRQSTQGMHAPVWCPDGDRSDFALDQCFEDANVAVIDWTMSEDLALVGRPRVRLRLDVDEPLAQVAVRICDVSASGASTLVAMGALNLTHRDGHRTPSAVTVGQQIDVEVPLRANGYVIPRGNRLRLAVTPGYWPMLWPSPRAAIVVLDPAHCSVDLPVLSSIATTIGRVPRDRPERDVDAPPVRWSSQVFGGDEVRMERVTDSGVVRLDDGSSWRVGGRTTWSTDDNPLDSTTTTIATMERERGAWRARWSATSTMSADEEWFHVTVTVSAFAAATSTNDETVFERSYGYDIARDHC